MSLDDASAERKAKLLALRAKRDAAASGESGKRKATDQGDSISIVHRAYDATTNQAKQHESNGQEVTIENAVEGLAQDIINQDAVKRQQDLNLLSIQPKKPNWDLKRDVDKKMSKLDYTYKSSVAKLIRNRIAADKGKGEDMQDLASAVSTRQQGDAISDDED